MIGTFSDVLRDMKNGVYDFTKDGECSSCGACCSSLLPISEKELKVIKRYVKKNHIKPQKHIPPTVEPTFDLTCPFRDDNNRICIIYSLRPQICRSFKCDKPQNDIWATKREFHAKYRVVDMREEIFEQ